MLTYWVTSRVHWVNRVHMQKLICKAIYICLQLVTLSLALCFSLSFFAVFSVSLSPIHCHSSAMSLIEGRRGCKYLKKNLLVSKHITFQQCSRPASMPLYGPLVHSWPHLNSNEGPSFGAKGHHVIDSSTNKLPEVYLMQRVTDTQVFSMYGLA